MRSVPVQSVRAAASTDLIPRIDSIRRAFFAPEPLVILFPRRFSRSTLASGVVGFLSEICTVRLSSLPPSLPSFVSFSATFLCPLVPADGISRGSGNGWKRWSLRVLGSFCFVPPYLRGIGDAYFITLLMARCPEAVCRPRYLRLHIIRNTVSSLDNRL